MNSENCVNFSAATHLDHQTVRAYAEATGDFNSIHLDDDAARSLGFEGAIAHGMLSLGWASVKLGELLTNEMPLHLQARFIAPVPVGKHISIAGARVESDVRPNGGETVTAQVVLENGMPVLDVSLSRGYKIDEHSWAYLPTEIVAENVLRVEHIAAIKVAQAIGASTTFLSGDAASRAGFTSIPAVPTFPYILPGVGFIEDDPENQGVPKPDAVSDSEEWANTDLPVVHGAQSITLRRFLLVGERLRSRTAILDRSERKRRNGSKLEFTEVRTVFESLSGEPVAVSDSQLVVIRVPPVIEGIEEKQNE